MSNPESFEPNPNKQPMLTTPPGFSRGVFYTGAGTAVNIALLFIETMVAVRLLDTESYGIYVLLVVSVGFLVMAADFGCKTAVTQLITSSDNDRQALLANSTLIFRLLVIALTSIFVLLGRNALLLLDPSKGLLGYVGYIPLMLLVTSLDELFLAMLQGFQAYRHMAVSQILRSILRLGISIFFLVVLDFGVNALIYSWIISFGVSAAYQFLVLPYPKRLFCQRSLMSELLRFGLPLQGNRILWFASSRIDVLLLSVLIGPASVAYYNVAARIPNALIRLSQSYIAVFFPTMTAMLADGKRKQAGWMLDRSLRLISFSLGIVALTAILFSNQIVRLFFSEKYGPSSLVFSLLMIVLPMSVLSSLMGYTLTAAGVPGHSLGANLAQTALVVLADLVMIPISGFMGPAYASLVSYYGTNPILIWLLKRRKISVTVPPYVKQMALLWFCAALFWWVRPVVFWFKLGIIILFVVLSLSLVTISRDDLMLVFPVTMKKRYVERKDILSKGR